MRTRPIRVRFDPSKSIRALVRAVIAQAEAQQKGMPGVFFAGAVLRHLVGAKLDCVIEGAQFDRKSVMTTKSRSGGRGDFLLGDVAIHVTTSPDEALIRRCLDNVVDGYRPVVVTLQRGLAVGERLAAKAGLAERIDFFEIEQFVALTVYKVGKFTGRRKAVHEIVKRYNGIVEQSETDPSLRIDLRL
jgi:Domain of unknown function (DUF4928)